MSCLLAHLEFRGCVVNHGPLYTSMLVGTTLPCSSDCVVTPNACKLVSPVQVSVREHSWDIRLSLFQKRDGRMSILLDIIWNSHTYDCACSGSNHCVCGNNEILAPGASVCVFCSGAVCCCVMKRKAPGMETTGWTRRACCTLFLSDVYTAARP